MLTDEIAHCGYINTFPRAGADERDVDRIEKRADLASIAGYDGEKTADTGIDTKYNRGANPNSGCGYGF